MGDEKNTGADGGNAGGDENDGAGQGDGGNDGAGDGNDQGNNEGDGGNADDQGQGDGNAQDEDGDDDTPPPVRKTATDFYKARQERKKNGKGNQANSKQNNDEAGDDDDSDEDDDVDPADKEVIDRQVKKQLKPVLDHFTAQADKQEAETYFAANPDFKPYEAKIMKWWNDPTRRHLPINTVALEAIGVKNLIRIGAQRQKAADDKARKTSTGGGSSTRDAGGSKPVAEMSNAEFEAERQRVLSKRGQ